MMELTVDEFMFQECSEGRLEELAGESDYWGKAMDFVKENRDERMGDLSFGQRNWLIKIKSDLLEQT